MTYVDAYEALLERAKTAGYTVHERYSDTLARPCVTFEAHPQSGEDMTRFRRNDKLEIVLTFMPELDARHDVKDQRDVMQFVDRMIDAFRLSNPIPGLETTVRPAGNAETEAYCIVSAALQSVDTVAIMADDDGEYIDDVYWKKRLYEEVK